MHILGFLIAFAAVQQVHTLPTDQDLDSLVWKPCNLSLGIAALVKPPPYPYNCANLSVPLDYSDPDSSEELVLNLVQVEALNKPAKGSIIFNPGGPGSAGVEYVATQSDYMHEILGGDFNLIGFDPRGSGKTIPFICNTTVLGSPVRARDLDGPTNMATIDEVLERELPEIELLAQACFEQASDIGTLMGTAFVARDMLQIVDALHEDGLLHYWGSSYGTYLGATFAAMFPDRVGRVLLDSNTNPHTFREGTYYDRARDTDKSFLHYIETCVARPDVCSIARHAPSGTAEELLQFFNSLQPLADARAKEDPNVFSWEELKRLVVLGLYDASTWKFTTNTIIDGTINRTLGIIEPETSPSSPPEDEDEDDDDDDDDDEVLKEPFYNLGAAHAIYGIACSDATLRVSDDIDDTFRAIVEQQFATGSFADVMYGLSWTCLHWKMHAKEVYEGDFRAKTKGRVLLVNGIFDPVTPHASAVNMSTGFQDSVLLTHKGVGHGVFGHPSLCTGHAIREYFAEGKLPEEGTECEPDVEVWDLPDLVEELRGGGVPVPPGLRSGLPEVGMQRRSMQGEMTEGDVRMWVAMRELGRQRVEMIKRGAGGGLVGL